MSPPLKFQTSRLAPLTALALCCFVAHTAVALSCVWRVTGPNGGTLYLGGSVHALRRTDYPLPAAYNRALDASSRLVFEDDPKTGSKATKDLLRAGTYTDGDNLKNHVDRRTYDYLRRFFGLVNIPEGAFSKYRPWLLNLLLSSPSSEHWQLGVERYLQRRAGGSKPIFGLESAEEHNGVFANLSDREAEALLLILFVNAGRRDAGGDNIFEAWRHGDADALARIVHDSFRDFPSLGERMLTARNRNWLPKIETFLRSDQTYFVVVGAAHLGGPGGVLSMLRARGYRAEQL